MNFSNPHRTARNLNDEPVFYTGLAEKNKPKMITPVKCKNCGNCLPDISNSELNVNEVNAKYCIACDNQKSRYSSKRFDTRFNFKSPSLSCSPINTVSNNTSTPVPQKVYSSCETATRSSTKRRSLLPHPTSNVKRKQSWNFEEQSVSPSFKAVFDNRSPNLNQRAITLKEKFDMGEGLSSDLVKRKRSNPSSVTCELSSNGSDNQSFISYSPQPNHRIINCKRKSDFQKDYVKRIRATSPAVDVHYSVPSDSYEDELSRSIWQLYFENKQTVDIYEKKMTLRRQLHEMLLNKFPNCGLYVVGSSMTGLGCNSSDMDMCLLLTDSVIDQRKEAVNILHSIRRLFWKCSYIKDCLVIPAKVPILRFRDSVSGIEVDLNINNTVGIRNTQLLLSYARIDNRLPPLVLLVKLWAQSHGINDAKNNTLSSYSLVLMVIHFLQYGCKPPVLPCLQRLQPDKYNPNADIRELKLFEDLPNYTSDNVEKLGDLFLGFLQYFAKEYNYHKNSMSVRLGSLLLREESDSSFSPNKAGHWKFLCIEEPFDLSNTARSVFKPEEFYYIRQVFENSLNTLKNYGDIKYLL